MVDQPVEINSVTEVQFDSVSATYIAELNVTQEGETFDASHVFRIVSDSAWSPWLLQEIGNGNITTVPYVRVIDPSEVDAERDRRKHLDLTFDVDANSKIFQADRASQTHMHEAAVWALKAVEAGAAEDDYLWNSNTENFQWILADNSLLLMDAHEMIGLWAAVSKRNTQLQLKGRLLKDMNPIPMNYTDNSFWE